MDTAKRQKGHGDTSSDTAVSLKKGDFNTLPAIHSIIGNSGFCAILNKKADNT